MPQIINPAVNLLEKLAQPFEGSQQPRLQPEQLEELQIALGVLTNFFDQGQPKTTLATVRALNTIRNALWRIDVDEATDAEQAAIRLVCEHCGVIISTLAVAKVDVNRVRILLTG